MFFNICGYFLLIYLFLNINALANTVGKKLYQFHYKIIFCSYILSELHKSSIQVCTQRINKSSYFGKPNPKLVDWRIQQLHN